MFLHLELFLKFFCADRVNQTRWTQDIQIATLNDKHLSVFIWNSHTLYNLFFILLSVFHVSSCFWHVSFCLLYVELFLENNMLWHISVFVYIFIVLYFRDRRVQKKTRLPTIYWQMPKRFVYLVLRKKLKKYKSKTVKFMTKWHVYIKYAQSLWFFCIGYKENSFAQF